MVSDSKQLFAYSMAWPGDLLGLTIDFTVRCGYVIPVAMMPLKLGF